MHILFIADYLPYPPISGGQLRAYNLIKRIAQVHQVSLVGFSTDPDPAEAVAHLRQFCHRVETATIERRPPLAHLPGLLSYTLAGRPWEFKFLYSEKLADYIRKLVASESFDIVQIETERMALYLESIPPGVRAKTVLMLYDIAFQQSERIFHFQYQLSSKVRTYLHSLALRRWEPHYLERFDRCITVSDVDRRLLTSVNPRLRLEVVPNGVDTQVYRPLPKENSRPALLFIGHMNYPPCIDGAIYLVREILPHVRQAVSDVEVWIVGMDPAPEVMQLDGDDVHVTGRVPDIVPYYLRSRVCVVPLRSGGGTRLKILEAMALGRPVVSTTIGCEGLNVVDDQDLLIADRPDDFAAKTVRLLSDASLGERITTHARQLVVTHYDWDALADCLNQIYAGMID